MVSFSRRLVISIVLINLVLAAGVVTVATLVTRKQMQESFDSALHGRAMSVAALVRFSEDEPTRLVFDGRLLPSPLNRKHPDVYKILDSSGTVLATSPGWNDVLLKTRSATKGYWSARYHNVKYRVANLHQIPVLDIEDANQLPTATISVIYAASSEEVTERLWSIAILTAIGTLILLAIATVATPWIVRKGLSPLAALAESAKRVSVTDWKLNAPDESRSTRELAPLVEAMDTMLRNLQQAFDSQRTFIGDAAHELKTPIAVLKSTLQLALQKPRTAEEYRLRLEHSLDDLARLETLTHSMLRLARAEQSRTAGNRGELPFVDVAESCESTVARLRPLAERKQVQIDIAASVRPQLRAEPDDLELIWSNLLDNSIRFSPTGSRVALCIQTEGSELVAMVRDHGPGVSKEELGSIFERFRRADTSRSRETGGYGLGLALVKAMVEAYGGSIVATLPEGWGMQMTVRLPLSL